jgi:hypothetical protein
MFNEAIESWYRAIETSFEVQHGLLQRWTRLWPAVSPSPATFGKAMKGQKRVEPSANRASRVPGFTRAELEELKEAFREYELTEGDWSKSR